MFDIAKNVNRLRRDIQTARTEINKQREELERREQSCLELEKLLVPLAQLAGAQPKNPLPEPVKEKMRASQRARWEQRRLQQAKKAEVQSDENRDNFLTAALGEIA